MRFNHLERAMLPENITHAISNSVMYKTITFFTHPRTDINYLFLKIHHLSQGQRIRNRCIVILYHEIKSLSVLLI